LAGGANIAAVTVGGEIIGWATLRNRAKHTQAQQGQATADRGRGFE